MKDTHAGRPGTTAAPGKDADFPYTIQYLKDFEEQPVHEKLLLKCDDEPAIQKLRKNVNKALADITARPEDQRPLEMPAASAAAESAEEGSQAA